MVIHIAATRGYLISGIDVGNAYLEAMSDRENLIMRLPTDWAAFGLHGVINGETKKIVEDVYVRLAGNLYGTPQGAMLWYKLLSNVLHLGGFHRLVAEPCCFMLHDSPHGVIILCVYVDDILIVAEKPSSMAWFKAWIATQFTKISDLGAMPKYLGMAVKRLEDGVGIELSQKDYILEIVADLKQKDKNLVIKKYATPLPVDLDPFLDLLPDGTESLLGILGKLRFLADRTRPDISFACSFLARFAVAPNAQHRKLALRVVGYVLDTVEETMVIGSCRGEIKLTASADASFIRGGESKGQIGYSMYLSEDSAAVHTKSQKDKNVAISSFHAEVNALVEAIKFALWARELLEELGVPMEEPTVIDQDNTGVIEAVGKESSDSRTRYLINKLNFVREQIQDGRIYARYTNTHENTSDGSTKSLGRIQCSRYRVGLLQGKIAAREELRLQQAAVADEERMEAAVHLTVAAGHHRRVSLDMQKTPVGKLLFLADRKRPEMQLAFNLQESHQADADVQEQIDEEKTEEQSMDIPSLESSSSNAISYPALELRGCKERMEVMLYEKNTSVVCKFELGGSATVEDTTSR